MIVVGQGPAPCWVWISPPRVDWIRARLARTGAAVIALGSVAVVVVLLNLPSSHHPFAWFGVVMGGLGAFWGLLAGLSLVLARDCARDGYFDVTNAQAVRRTLGVLWGAVIACATIAGLLQVGLLSDDTRPVPFTVGVALYFVALYLLVVLGGVAFFAGRGVLRVSP
ncbi:hypothetical protein [Lentzea sp. NPDC059081]|uniref:hypothetical protein n=1 Tax=Lentzea sp. NPDC059081 TaxID=3346719 RepID=UPI00368C55E2